MNLEQSRKKQIRKNLLLYAGVEKSEYEQIREEIQKGNRQNLLFFAVLSGLALMIMFILSFYSIDARENRWIYAGTAVLMFILIIVAKYFAVEHPWLLFVSIYIFMGILFIFGILLGTVTRPEEQTVTFIALLLTVPLLFLDQPIRMILNVFTYVIIFCIAAYFTKERDILFIDITDVFVYGSLSAIVSSYMMCVKARRYLFEQKVVELSEKDILTGLFNRNSYEKAVKTYTKPWEGSLTCIFIDANGLHELNNAKGHEAGDLMLQLLAKNIKDYLGTENSYRIGGDEFVSFVSNESDANIRENIERIAQRMEKESYSISVGMDTMTQDEGNINQLVKNAEKRMYLAKEAFYQKTENDRRTRR